MNCLLCSSGDVVIKETVSREDLLNLWKRDVDVTDDIKTAVINKYHCNNCTLTFYDPVNAGGNKFYSALGEYEWYYLHPGKTEYDYVQKLINENAKVLDIGSGRGELFNRTKKKIYYTGLELSNKAVELAQSAGINVKNEDLLVHADSHVSEYDLVTLFQVLEHLTELDKFITAIKDCLKPGGLFCIAVPNNDGFISYTPNYIYNMPPHHTILWTESSLRYLAEKFDFNVVDVELELLQDVHKENAYLSYLIYIIKRCTFQPVLLLENSKSHQLITRIASRLLRSFLFRKLTMSIFTSKVKYGQSIIVTLQKK
jgi:2-polyprenyl-3-methyl-5-hydroxy-6-metoxy-1,4-benzoquinol methylase